MSKYPTLRSLIFRLMLSVSLALTGLAGLLVTRLRHPLVLELLSPWREPGLDDDPTLAWSPLINQFEIDLISATMAGLGLFLIVYYRRRLSPVLYKLEDMSLDRW